jgi:hypothetical protein
MEDKKITVENKGKKGKKKPTVNATEVSASRDPVGSGQGSHGQPAPDPLKS